MVDSFQAVPGEGAIATVEGRRIAVGNARLLDREGITLHGLAQRAAALAGDGRPTVQVGVDGRAAGVIAITIGRSTQRKMHQNLGWAIGYNSLALPIAAGILEPIGFTLSPAIGALSMSGSSVIVALKRRRAETLPAAGQAQRHRPHKSIRRAPAPWPAFLPDVTIVGRPIQDAAPRQGVGCGGWGRSRRASRAG